MRLIARPASRWPRVPPGIALFAGLWALTVLAARLVAHYTGVDPDLCLFHRATGYSCPTCGTTRGLLAFVHGSWRQGFLWNPMTMALGLAGILVLLGRLLTARTLELKLSVAERRIAILLALTALGANWAWLIRTHP